MPIAIFAFVAAVFSGQTLARAIYVNHYEFEPARLEWEAAHASGDMLGMQAAFHKELEANRRTIDPFWLVDYFKGN